MTGTPLNLNLDTYNKNNSIKFNSFFFVRPSSTAVWVSLLSDQPIDLSSIKNLSVTKLVKPKPILIANSTNLIQSTLPKISYEKINTTKYTVHIADASSPFILIFSELFNNKWEAFYDDNIVVTSHFRANSYANGWFIDKKGDFDITVEFTPQRLYKAGEIVALFSQLLNGGALAVLLIKHRVKAN